MALQRRFPYETLLRIRRRQEDLKAQALAVARHEVEVAQAQRRHLAEEQRGILDQAGERSRAYFDASDVRRYYQYERHLARLRDAKDAEIHALRDIEEERRIEVEEAAKRKRIVEKLKERHGVAWLRQWRKNEQRLMDEAGTTHAATRRALLSVPSVDDKE